MFNVTLNAGDTVTLSDTTAVAVTDTLTVGSNTQTFSTPGSASFTVVTSGPYSVTASGAFSPIIGTVTLSCAAGTASVVQQQANNAQIAITNGLRTLQNYQEWVTKGLQGSFGMTRARAARRPAPAGLRKGERRRGWSHGLRGRRRAGRHQDRSAIVVQPRCLRAAIPTIRRHTSGMPGRKDA